MTSRTGTMHTVAIAQMSAGGNMVSLFKADSTCRTQMRAVFSQARRSLRPGTGHFAHAAGVSGMTMLTDLRPREFWSVASTKASRYILNPVLII
jgi:hypothetical protein